MQIFEAAGARLGACTFLFQVRSACLFDDCCFKQRDLTWLRKICQIVPNAPTNPAFGTETALICTSPQLMDQIISVRKRRHEESYFCLKSLMNSLDFMKFPISFELASWMIILTVFTPSASEHRVAHPAGSTQLAMHPAVQLIAQVGWSSIIHVAA
jgi:hypothetical protein